MSEENPKLKGSLIIDCVPQTGDCQLKCAECYYNRNFYRSKDTPLLPTFEESVEKIVRVNSGHDSNLQRDLVVVSTRQYKDKFYNTSLPLINFDAPVVITLNGRDTDNKYLVQEDIGDYMFKRSNVMAVRFRVNTWNIQLCEDAIEDWSFNTVILTPMRYSSVDTIPELHRRFYSESKHILHTWFCLNDEGNKIVKQLLRHRNVFWCGNPFSDSSYCADCRVCEHLYVAAKERMRCQVSG